jgi:hypothetical protein
VGSFLEKAKKLYVGVCYTAWFANIFVLFVGAVQSNKELQVLSLVNMILLSFILIKDTNENST